MTNTSPPPPRGMVWANFYAPDECTTNRVNIQHGGNSVPCPMDMYVQNWGVLTFYAVSQLQAAPSLYRKFWLSLIALLVSGNGKVIGKNLVLLARPDSWKYNFVFYFHSPFWQVAFEKYLPEWKVTGPQRVDQLLCTFLTILTLIKTPDTGIWR